MNKNIDVNLFADISILGSPEFNRFRIRLILAIFKEKSMTLNLGVSFHTTQTQNRFLIILIKF